ncbi:MAG TPA: hypothetical protein DF984_07405 [Anaerolineaceae bacterium]|nr:hypothetical protein [Anaerolineaceae bacterium]
MAGVKRNHSGLPKLLFGLSLVCLAFGLISLAWAVWPTSEDAAQFTIEAGVLPGAPAGTSYAAVTDYTLSLNWPTWLRKGDTGTLRVTLAEAGQAGGAAADQPAQVIVVEPVISSLPIDPPGRVQASAAAGHDLELAWELTGGGEGDYEGKVAVLFAFYDEEQAALVTVPVVVVDVATRVDALWGLEANLVLWLGFVGLVLWGALFVIGRVVEGKE